MAKSKKYRKLLKSAKMGKPQAMYRTGLCCQTGRMTEKDMTKAALWMTAASDKGYPPAEEWLNDYYFDDDALIQAES